MNAQMFLENFGYIANAPDGVNRLRELLLAIAMQGKLVPQNSNDSPASELLKEIETEKKQLVKEKKIKPKKPLPQVKAEEVPYEIPKGWVWVRLGNIGNIFNGNSINAREKEVKYKGTIGLPYIATKDVKYGLQALNYTNGIFIPESEHKFKIAHQGAVLICSEGGSAGKKCGITDRDICFGNKLFANELLGGIPSKLILYQYLTPFFTFLFRGAMTGIIGGVSIVKFVELLIPLPPLAEQKRIVAKVDELMALCDKLEAQQQERERRFPLLSRACHARFAETPTPANLKAIFDETETVSPEDLRKTLLDLGIRGKLVRQDVNDELASDLLKKIEAEKEALVASEFIKKERSQVKEELEVPFDLPRGWRWVELKDIFIVITDGDHQPPPKKASGVPFLVISDVRSGILDFSNTRYVSEEYYDSLDPIRKPASGDILYTLVGSFGIPVLLPDDRRFCVQRHIGILKPSKNLSAEFIARILSSSLVFDQVADCATGIAQKTVPLRGLRRVRIPLPPLSEQRRIVAKLNHLLALADRLESQQTEKSKVAEAFAQATITAITGTETKEQIKMKAPKTELISQLQTKSKPKATDQAPLAKLVSKHNGELAAKALWQQSGLEIDAFYQQLKTEMANGWIVEPDKAVMKEIEAN